MILFVLCFCFILNSVSSSDFSACGETKFIQGLMYNGNDTQRGQFPFLCALYNIEKDKRFCGGSLITTQHVLTAAHCIQEKSSRKRLDAVDLLVYVGRHNFKIEHERDSKSVNVKNIHLHEDWKTTTISYDADVAILELQENIVPSTYIKTVCLPEISFEDDLKHKIGGTVVGWGLNATSNFVQDMPSSVVVRTELNENCFLTDNQITPMASNRTFCAIGEKSGPCRGDSGGGLYVRYGNKWIIRGIVSASLGTGGKCDVNTYAVYGDVYKYIDWIKEKITVDTIANTEANISTVRASEPSEPSKPRVFTTLKPKYYVKIIPWSELISRY